MRTIRAASERPRPEGVEACLREGFALWEEAGLPPLEEELRYREAGLAGELYRGAHALEFAAACQCFALFRRLHRRAGQFSGAATLLGDYFFSQFSHYLIPLNSAPLNDAFARYLAEDAAGRAIDYPVFLRKLPAVIQP